MKYLTKISIFLYLISLFCWVTPSLGAADYTKTPVFFVHGYGVGAGSWGTMISYLTASDYPPLYLRAIQLDPNTGANIPAAEDQIAPAIEDFLTSINTFLSTQYPHIPLKTKVDLISHSMGGLSSRWYAVKVHPDRVRNWISLAGANHGTDVLCGWGTPGSDDLCPAYAASEKDSLIQYVLNGAPHLADVDETPYGIGTDSPGVTSLPPYQRKSIFYVTIRTSPDAWIKPENSVILDGTGGLSVSIPQNVQATERSPGNFLMINGVGHDAMLSDDDTKELVKVILGIADGDLDHDGITDSVDNCYDYYNPDQKDRNSNGIGDACECEGDFDSDSDVDGSDLAVFAADFGRTDCITSHPCEGNFDADGDVDGSDLAVFAADFGRTACPIP